MKAAGDCMLSKSSLQTHFWLLSTLHREQIKIQVHFQKYFCLVILSDMPQGTLFETHADKFFRDNEV